jgi:hypothetical protein
VAVQRYVSLDEVFVGVHLQSNASFFRLGPLLWLRYFCGVCSLRLLTAIPRGRGRLCIQSLTDNYTE